MKADQQLTLFLSELMDKNHHQNVYVMMSMKQKLFERIKKTKENPLVDMSNLLYNGFLKSAFGFYIVERIKEDKFELNEQNVNHFLGLKTKKDFSIRVNSENALYKLIKQLNKDNKQLIQLTLGGVQRFEWSCYEKLAKSFGVLEEVISNLQSQVHYQQTDERFFFLSLMCLLRLKVEHGQKKMVDLWQFIFPGNKFPTLKRLKSQSYQCLQQDQILVEAIEPIKFQKDIQSYSFFNEDNLYDQHTSQMGSPYYSITDQEIDQQESKAQYTRSIQQNSFAEIGINEEDVQLSQLSNLDLDFSSNIDYSNGFQSMEYQAQELKNLGILDDEDI